MIYVRVAAAVLAALLISLALAFVYRLGGANARADLAEYKAQVAEQRTKAAEAARATERKHAQELAAIAEQYERDKKAADEAQRKLVSDLRAGTVRLRKEWRGCETGAAATASQLDAETRAREAAAGAVIRVGRDADDQIRRLQDIVRKDRE